MKKETNIFADAASQNRVVVDGRKDMVKMKYVKSNFSLTEDGLYLVNGRERERIAQAFDVSGSTAEGSGLVQFKNPDRKLHSVTVTTKMLRGRPRKPVAQLADGGMFVSGTNKARRAFVEFLALMMAPSE